MLERHERKKRAAKKPPRRTDAVEPRANGILASLRDQSIASFLDNMPGMVYRCRNDRDWTMEFASGGAFDLTGYHPHELENNALVSYGDLIHPDDRAMIWQQVQDGIARNESFRLVYRIRARDGREKWVWEQGRGVRDGSGELLFLEGFIFDITESKKIEDALLASEERYRNLVELSPDGICIYGNERLLYVNSTAIRLLGMTDFNEFRNLTIHDFIGPANDDKVRRRIQQIEENGAVPLTVEEVVRRDGSRFDVEVASRRIRYEDQPATLVVFRDISARRQSERQLQEALSRFESVIEHTPLVAIQGFDREGVISHWNHASETIYGIPRDEALGRRMGKIMPGENDSCEFEQRLKTAWDSRAASPPFERQVSSRTGGVNWLYSSMFPVVLDGETREVFRMDVNISSRKIAEEQLNRARTLLESVVINLPVAMFLKDARELRFLMWNRANEELLGIGAEEVLGKTDFDLFPKEQAQFFADMDRQTIERGQLQDIQEESISTRNRGTRILHTRKIPIFEGSVPLYLLGISEDITDLKRAEEERRRLEAQILQAQKLESLGILAGGIAHDFNNLLTAILGYADLAASESPPGSCKESLQQIVQTARRAADLTRQMLAYSGRGRFTVQSLHLSHVISEMAHLLEASISKQCELRYHFDWDLPSIEADAAQIRQVVMNLIINASEAIGDAPGIITVSTGASFCRRDVLAESYLKENLNEGMYVYLDVADTGCGMTLDTRNRLFDPFFTTKFTGRGLGLPAVLGIVRGHNGAIQIKSGVGKGTTFRVLFPALSETASAESAPAREPAPEGRAGTILLVDDEEIVREIAEKMLVRGGYQVVPAKSGRECLDILRQGATPIDLIILDMTMPRMSGEETFREIRRLDSRVPVLLSSGYGVQDVMARLAGQNPSGFLQKPFVSQQLIDTVRSVLNRAGPGR